MGRVLQGLGVEFGSDLNAYTSCEATVYQLWVPTTAPGAVEVAFDILDQWATAATLEPAAVEAERGVVLDEYRAKETVEGIITDHFDRVYTNGSVYAGCDPIGTREMKDLILRFRDEGKTIVMCSHLLADVQDVCDRIAILHQGELKELGRVDDLLTVADVTQIRASGLTPECRAELGEVIKRRGGKLLEMDNPSTTLEELFLSIVHDSEARPGRRVVQNAKPTESVET